MPILLGSIIGALMQACGTLVGRVLVSLGIGYVTYTGIDTSIAWARDFAVSHIQSLPALALQVVGTLQIGVCISILTSALATRMVLQGLTSGAIKRMVTK